MPSAFAVLVLSAWGSDTGQLRKPSAVAAPVIHVIGPNPQYLQTTDKFYEDEGATCHDQADGWISELIDVEGNIADLERPGQYKITYSCKNSAGVSATPVDRVVVVTGNFHPKDGDYVVKAKVNIEGLSVDSFRTDAQNNFCISVADVLAVPVRNVGIISVDPGPIVKLHTATQNITTKSTGVVFAVTMATGKEAAKSVAIHIESDTFGQDVESSIKKKPDLVKSDLVKSLYITLEPNTVSVTKFSSWFFSPSVYYVLVSILAVLSWLAAYRAGAQSTTNKVEMTSVEERAPLNASKGNDGLCDLSPGSLAGFASDLQAEADSRKEKSEQTDGQDKEAGNREHEHEDPKDD